MTQEEQAFAYELAALRVFVAAARQLEREDASRPQTHEERYADRRIKVSAATLERLIRAVEALDDVHRRASHVVGTTGLGRAGLGIPPGDPSGLLPNHGRDRRALAAGHQQGEDEAGDLPPARPIQ